MTTETIKDLLTREKYNELCTKFREIDQKSTSINQWQKAWGLPLQHEGCQLAHNLRNALCSFDLNYFGDRFYSGKPGEFKSTATQINKPDALKAIEVIEATRDRLTEVIAEIHSYLYPKN